MSSVTVGGPGLVAVGSDGVAIGSDESGATQVAAVWTSVDGLSWSRVPHDEAVFGGGGSQQMWGVTAGGPGLVAVGRDTDVSIAKENAAVWTSVDGLTWSRVPHDEAAFGGHKGMNRVIAGGPGLVAVGFDDPQAGAVWTSVDGVTWSQVPYNEAVFGGPRVIDIWDVAVGGPGLVAVGAVGSGANQAAAVWTSADGLSWSRVPHDEAVFGEGQGMSSVTVGGPGLVAVGAPLAHVLGSENAHEDAAVWTSEDGIIWSRVPHNEAAFGGQGNQKMNAVIAGDFGLVAVGSDSLFACTTIPSAFICDEHADAAVWNN